VSVAPALVIVPAEFDTTTLYWEPLSASVAAGVV
jgi:hypothetical protein